MVKESSPDLTICCLGEEGFTLRISSSFRGGDGCLASSSCEASKVNGNMGSRYGHSTDDWIRPILGLTAELIPAIKMHTPLSHNVIKPRVFTLLVVGSSELGFADQNRTLDSHDVES